MRDTPDSTPKISWQEALARLARERRLAVTSARLLKAHGSEAAQASASVAYGAAKDAYDGIIDGLLVVLSSKAKGPNLFDLGKQLRCGFQQREALCQTAQRLAVTAGEEGFIEDAAKGSIRPLLEAIGHRGALVLRPDGGRAHSQGHRNAA